MYTPYSPYIHREFRDNGTLDWAGEVLAVKVMDLVGGVKVAAAMVG